MRWIAVSRLLGVCPLLVSIQMAAAQTLDASLTMEQKSTREVAEHVLSKRYRDAERVASPLIQKGNRYAKWWIAEAEVDGGFGVDRRRNGFIALHELALGGFPPAQMSVGHLYEIGSVPGVKRSRREANRWYCEAVKGGDMSAALDIAELNGGWRDSEFPGEATGDPVIRMMWLYIASVKAPSEVLRQIAQRRLKRMQEGSTKLEDIVKAQELAASWTPQRPCEIPSDDSQVSPTASSSEEEVSRILRGPHAILPGPVERDGTNHGEPIVSLINKSGYALRVFLVGPIQKSIALDDGKRVEIQITQGSYQVAARVVDVSGVLPLYRESTFRSRGRYEFEFYLTLK